MVGFHEENPDPGLVLEVQRRVNCYTATSPGPILVHCRSADRRFYTVVPCLQILMMLMLMIEVVMKKKAVVV